METLGLTLQLIGAYVLVIWAYETFRSTFGICRGLWRQWIHGQPDDFVRRYGQWAVITGGSDGIGRQYSLFLAEKGFKIAILAMQDDKLDAIKQELESKFQVEVRAIPVDFSKGFEIKEYLEKQMSDLSIGILVNNVGVGTRFGAYFDSFPLELHRSLINVNIAAAVMMSYIALPGMKRRGRGLLINVSSVSGLAPVPTVLAYGASKAFVYCFSEALREELAPFGVEVQTVTPNIVATKMTERFSAGFVWRILSVPVDTYGKFMTMTIGKTCLTTGHWKHAIAVTIQKILPETIVSTLGHKIGHSVWCEDEAKSN